jgi:hypothetical protein
MMAMSSNSTWPPRRLPSRMRLIHIRMIRLQSDILLPVAHRLTLWTVWLALTGTAFLLIDLFT